MLLRREPRHLLFGLTPGRYSFVGLYWLAALFLGGVLAAAILAPPVFLGIQAWAQADAPGWVTYLAEKDFPRYFDRLRWPAVLVLLLFMIRALGLGSAASLGFAHPRPLRSLALWFALGYATMALVVAAQAIAVPIRFTGEPLGTALAVALLAGLLVGLAEEFLFRGVLLRTFYAAMPPLTAVVLSSVIFAGLHFKDVPAFLWTEGDPVTWLSGFPVGFGTVISPIFTANLIEFLNLTLVGIVLGLVFLWRGSLWPCIGLHAGWVALRNVWRDAARVETTPFWGNQSLTNALATLLLLLALAITILLLYRRDQRKETAP